MKKYVIQFAAIGMCTIGLLYSCIKQEGKVYQLPNGQTLQVVPLRDYQIEIVEDSLLIYDGNRFVGHIPFSMGQTLIDSLIMKDNE